LLTTINGFSVPIGQKSADARSDQTNALLGAVSLNKNDRSKLLTGSPVADAKPGWVLPVSMWRDCG
jgi:hypothetical protein